MKKLKLLVSSLIAMLAFAIFAVTGIKVNAATAVDTGTYSWKPENSWTSGTKGLPNVVTSGIYTAGGTAQRNAFGSLVSSGLTNDYSETKEWTYELRYYSGTLLQVTIGDNQSADYEIYAYTSKDNNKRSITVGSNTAHSLNKNTVERLTGTVEGGTSSIVISGDQVCLLEANFKVSNSSSTKTLDRITVSNSKTYYTGDTVLASDFSVTGIYIDDTTSEESSKILDSSSYTVVVKKDDIAVQNNVLTTGGTHVAHITVNDTQVSNTFEFNANVATHGDGTVFNPSNLEAENFASSRIIDGTIFKILSTDSTKVRIDANNKTIDDFSFTKRLVFGGKASTTSCALLVKAPSAGKLIVYGMSNSSGNTRTLGLYTSNLENVDVEGFSNDGNAIARYEYTIADEGDYLLGAVASGFSIYYVAFTPVAVTAGIVTGVDSDNKTAVAFIAKIENVTDVALLANMSFHLVATHGVAKEADYTDVTTCYTALTAFGNGTISGYGSSNNTYYVYFVVSGIEDKYDGLTLKVTFNASYDGVALTQTTFDTYTYTVSSQA